MYFEKSREKGQEVEEEFNDDDAVEVEEDDYESEEEQEEDDQPKRVFKFKYMLALSNGIIRMKWFSLNVAHLLHYFHKKMYSGKSYRQITSFEQRKKETESILL